MSEKDKGKRQMIAANYTMHLYCDCADCTAFMGEVDCHPGHAEYVGESWSEVARSARKDGWRISKDRTRCFAPGHKIRRNIE